MTNEHKQFPALSADLVYLDNAATTQICEASIRAMETYWQGGRANIGRGVYPLAERSFSTYESARKTVASFVDAEYRSTIFVKSSTEGLNALAYGLREHVERGDEILVSPFEHHANLLPWRRLARERAAKVKMMPMTADFMLDVDAAVTMVTSKTKIIATTLVSNVLGAIVPVKELVGKVRGVAQNEGVMPFVIVDAAQAVAHIPVSLSDLGVDAVVFGAHKMYGPEGIGAMACSSRVVNVLEPLLVGGGMVDSVTENGEVLRNIPERFEGGSPNVAGAIGFAAAVEKALRARQIMDDIKKLRAMLIDGLRAIKGVDVLDPREAISIVSFTVDGVHPHDVADMLGQRGVCVRAGHHCAAPLVNIIAPNGGTVRVSFAMYSTKHDVERLLHELSDILPVLQPSV